MYSMLGLIEIAPRCSGPSPGRQVKSRQLAQRDVDLARGAAHAEVADLPATNSSGQVLALDELQEAALGVGRRHARPWRAARRRSPAPRRRRGRPCTMTCCTGALVRISTPSARAELAIACGHAAVAVLGEAPGAERAVDLAHVVVQQHVGRARRMRAEEGADDAAGGLGALERVEFEPVVRAGRPTTA